MKQICSIEGCDKPIVGRGWCRKHYMRWYINGDPIKLYKTQHGLPAEFMQKAINYLGDECILWPFTTNNQGYPQIGYNGKTTLVTRLICSETNGSAPTPSHQAAHSCGNGHLGCITRKHLRWATPAENSTDRITHGHSGRGESSPLSKLTEAQVLEIYRRSSTKEQTQQEIAEEFGVCQTTVSMINLGKNWGWLTGATR